MIGGCLYYVQENKREHAGHDKKVSGIHLSVKTDLAQMMKLVGATKAINSLKTRYCKDGQLDKIAYLPTTKQAENFKRYVLTKCKNYRTYASMVENLIEFQVDDKVKFDDIADMDRLIFL